MHFLEESIPESFWEKNQNWQVYLMFVETMSFYTLLAFNRDVCSPNLRFCRKTDRRTCCRKTERLWISEFISNSEKYRVQNHLDFFSSSNLIFTACVACKNQFRNQIDFLIFQTWYFEIEKNSSDTRYFKNQVEIDRGSAFSRLKFQKFFSITRTIFSHSSRSEQFW